MTETPAWGITREQYDYLRHPINDNRVRWLGAHSHVEAWDVRRTLTRVFGYGGWDLETRDLVLVKEIEHPARQDGGKSRWTVVYRADVRLVVKDAQGREICHFDDSAAGDSANQPSLGDAHDNACKTALSQALKRCAVNLGDQFGLSLYNKQNPSGSEWPPVVVASVIRPEPVAGETPTAEDAPAVHGGEMDDRQDGQFDTEPDDATSRIQRVVAPPKPRAMTAQERTGLVDAVALAADAAHVTREDVAAQWAASHGGEHIKDATDKAGLEKLRDELRAMRNGARQETK